MKTYSDILPESFKINNISKGYAEIMLAENITETTDGYEYDLYIITLPYRERLADSIANNLDVWLQYAKAKQAETHYTAEQLLQQEITELQLENIEQGQQITDLELMILEG